MLDTLKIVSPPMPPEMVQAIASASVHRLAVDNATGEKLWEFTSGELVGSYDHRVRFTLRDDCIWLEGSVHKLLLGHNVIGGSDDLHACANFLVEGLASRLGLRLPPARWWIVKTIDNAEAYLLDSFEAVEGYFRAAGGVSYPRRTVSRHGFHSIHVAGRNTTLKLYHKGPEFNKHDRKRLRKSCMLSYDIDWLQAYANRVLRSEVSIRRRLVDDFGHWPTVAEIPKGYATRIHNSEMAKLVREGKSQMDTVRTFLEVKQRLQDLYTPRKAHGLLGTWLQLSAMGEEETRKGMTRRTYYRHRKELQEACCSWHSTDIMQTEPLFPVDFMPISTDPRCVSGEHPDVAKQLDPFRVA